MRPEITVTSKFKLHLIHNMAKKVFVSGCYDLLHSGHVEFFKQASQFGDLYVGLGSDAKRRLCEERGIDYVELQRTPAERRMPGDFGTAGH